MIMFLLIAHDHLDHETVIDEFQDLETAKVAFKEAIATPPDIYDYGWELVDDSNDEFETLEWVVTQEEPQD